MLHDGSYVIPPWAERRSAVVARTRGPGTRALSALRTHRPLVALAQCTPNRSRTSSPLPPISSGISPGNKDVSAGGVAYPAMRDTRHLPRSHGHVSLISRPLSRNPPIRCLGSTSTQLAQPSPCSLDARARAGDSRWPLAAQPAALRAAVPSLAQPCLGPYACHATSGPTWTNDAANLTRRF